MEKHFITALLVFVLLAPQTGLEAKSRHHGVKERDHDAEERDHEDKKRYHKSKKRHHKSKQHHHSARKFFRLARTTKAELELLKQLIAEINAKMEALEPQGQLPADPAITLIDLRADVDTNRADINTNIINIGINESGITQNSINITQNMDDIIDINAEIVAIKIRLGSLENSEPASSSVNFSALFTIFEVADPIALGAWSDFLDEATGDFSSIEIKNNLGGLGVKCEDSNVATVIAGALNNRGTTSIMCPDDDRWWNVAPFNEAFDPEGLELNAGATDATGQCNIADASVRPTNIGVFWGGVGTDCNAPTQMLEVILTR